MRSYWLKTCSFPAQNAFSSRVVKRSEDLRQQVLGELNEFRAKYADAAQVSNMNELVSSDEHRTSKIRFILDLRLPAGERS